jgi:alpha-L-rhamnosidase
MFIAPTPGGKLTSADVRYDSIRGRIETAWKKSGDKLSLNVTIPANTTTTVLVPAKSATRSPEAPKAFGAGESPRREVPAHGRRPRRVGGGGGELSNRLWHGPIALTKSELSRLRRPVGRGECRR